MSIYSDVNEPITTRLGRGLYRYVRLPCLR